MYFQILEKEIIEQIKSECAKIYKSVNYIVEISLKKVEINGFTKKITDAAAHAGSHPLFTHTHFYLTIIQKSYYLSVCITNNLLQI